MDVPPILLSDVVASVAIILDDEIIDPLLSSIIHTVLAKDGLDLYLWDIAVACLSLSVKVAPRRVFLILNYNAHECF